MSGRRGCDPQIHDASSGLSTCCGDSGCGTAVLAGDLFVEGERVELPLAFGELEESVGPGLRGACDEDSEVEFGQAGRADGDLRVVAHRAV